MLYADLGDITLHQGHVLDVLAAMPAESVDCCVTSPPYWGLRDYKLGPQVWDGQPECEHEWGIEIPLAAGSGGESDKQLSNAGSRFATTSGQFCRLCDAWRGSLGLEPTPELFCQHIVQVFREIKRVLRKDGTLWLNLGDSYAGSGKGPDGKQPGVRDHPSPAYSGNGIKPKDMVGIPWMVAFALRADGWYLRSEIVWHKPNPMPESVEDRPTRSHEYIFLLSNSRHYYYDNEAIREPQKEFIEFQPGPRANIVEGNSLNGGFAHKEGGFNATRAARGVAYNPSGRNKRSVWTVPTQAFPEAHFATFPEDLIRPCVLAGCRPDGTVLDPFAGSCTTGLVARQEGRKAILIDLSEAYLDMGIRRLERQPQRMVGI